MITKSMCTYTMRNFHDHGIAARRTGRPRKQPPPAAAPVTPVTWLAPGAWPLLRLAGVRPAWPVALIALPVAFILGRAYQAFAGSPAWGVPGLIVVPAVSYAAAALLTAPGARPVRTIALGR